MDCAERIVDAPDVPVVTPAIIFDAISSFFAFVLSFSLFAIIDVTVPTPATPVPIPDVIVSDFAGLFGNGFLKWKKKYVYF